MPNIEHKVQLECKECKNRKHTFKNPKIKQKLVLSKFCRSCKKHTEHKETK